MNANIAALVLIAVLHATSLSAGEAKTEMLIGWIERPKDSSVCRCEFYRFPIQGQLVFIRSCDLNAPLRALMSIDGEPVILSQSKSNWRATIILTGQRQLS
jgi:hypothetical protein